GDLLRAHPLRVRVGVLAVGGDDVIVRLQGGEGADRDRFLPDIKMQEAAELAQGVGLGQRFLHAPDGQHLVVVPGEGGLVGGARGVGLGSLTLDCAHCQGFSGPLLMFRGFGFFAGVKSAKIYQEARASGRFDVSRPRAKRGSAAAHNVHPPRDGTQLPARPADVKAAMEASTPGGPTSGPIEAAPGPDPVAVDAPSRGLILLVDDEPAIARAYARTLGAAGFTVVTASDGREAADAAREKSFDVIGSDIAMPTMDGIELLRTVREYDLDVPFVIMTGGPAVDSAARAMEYGALRYLVKPVEPAA